MRWRCDFCWVLNSEESPTCVRCGRDVMVPTRVAPKVGPGRPRIPDGDGNEEARRRDRERKARKKAMT